MTPTRAKELLPVIQAFAEGKKIQFKDSVTQKWADGDQFSFDYSSYQYRIKPEPKWRAWKPSEVPRAFMVASKSDPHTDGKWQVAEKGYSSHIIVIDGGWHLSDKTACHRHITPEELFDQFVQIHPDGSHTPCGVLETP